MSTSGGVVSSGVTSAFAVGDGSATSFVTTSNVLTDITATAGNHWLVGAAATASANGQVTIAASVGDVLFLSLYAGLVTTTANNGYGTFSVGGADQVAQGSGLIVDSNAANADHVVLQAVVVVTAPMIGGGVVACKPRWFSNDGVSTITILNRVLAAGPGVPVFTVLNLKH